MLITENDRRDTRAESTYSRVNVSRRGGIMPNHITHIYTYWVSITCINVIIRIHNLKRCAQIESRGSENLFSIFTSLMNADHTLVIAIIDDMTTF